MSTRDDRTAVGTGVALEECRKRLREIAAAGAGPAAVAMVAPAKLLRARVVLASGLPLGATPAALAPATVAIELVHLASLVHDDIIDDAHERRGVPALHLAVGRDRALVVGDLLLLTAIQVLGEVAETRPAEVVSSAVLTLTEAARLCCAGQLAELDAPNGYLEMIAKKTGALFAAAAGLGALIAGASDDQADALRRFGTTLGSAYQIRDDLYDGSPLPSSSSYTRARSGALEALARAPAQCRAELRALTESMLDLRGVGTASG